MDVTHNPSLFSLEFSGNYLTGIDLTQNKILNHLHCRVTYLKELDLSRNLFLKVLNCSSTDIKALDLSHNSQLRVLSCDGLMLSSILSVDVSGREDYPYKINLNEYLEGNYNINFLGAFDKNFGPIGCTIDDEFNGTIYCASSPVYASYSYPTGYTGEAEIQDSIVVILHIPTRSWIYLPRVEPEVKDPSDDMRVAGSENSSVEIERGKVYQRDNSEFIPMAITPGSEEVQASGGSSGGCNSGLGILAVLALIFGKKRKFLVICLIIAIASSVQANIRASDYVLPIQIDRYTPAGTWTTDFEMSPALVGAVAEKAGVSAENVHSYSEIISAGTWNFRAQDIAYLANNGMYGGVLLPVAEPVESNDVYVIKCTFSNDIQPGELIAGISATQVDALSGKSYPDETKSYLTSCSAFDENFREVDSVPQSRTIYLAVFILHTNTGILSIVRGRYVEEEDPLLRLDDDVAQSIADELGIASSDLKYLTRANFGLPVEATEAMKIYVKSDDHEIIADLPTISVDEEGIYVVPMTLSYDVWEMLKDQDISEYKFYALNDSDLGSGQMRTAFINGLLGTWEIFSMTGEKLEKFGVREFLMVGFLEAGKPFSLYLGKLLLALLMGGCTSGFAGATLVVVFLSLTIFIRRNTPVDRRNNHQGRKRT